MKNDSINHPNLYEDDFLRVKKNYIRTPKNYFILVILTIIALQYGFVLKTNAASPLCSSSPTTFGYEYVSSVTINGVTKAGNTGFLVLVIMTILDHQ